ncbi:ATP-dependent DNA helicase RecG [Nocardioides ganghwensis]|jgi:ATP-dependent DNA helicase RecG|uniref:Probable DNA 3'-5' helicase RecG n=1 Tax=Nocardioides ganghwensis TaxID=252230 RepID=A0A4Q2SBZ5_9ACTN|nr:ATP-dependent DNA helicase RecG [Nocardioides ganghwensis]MBD3946844.1 ATP-dependent DNA helicase RecG [Nocardioides ganghwensis]RYC02756.1 ATP-dependent DNA helicase RecG [Nocardioides ganghwensis]
MVAITPDSPIGSVFGNHHKKRKLAEEGLGLATVGDLLRHFPRRYVAATELSEVATPAVGEQLTIVGEVRSCDSAAFFSGNRRQFRTTVRLRTDGPDFSVTLFSPYQNLADRHEAEFRPGCRAVFTGKAKQFRGSWQLEQPHGFALDGPEAATLSKLMPVYPLTAKLYTWDIQKVVTAALDLVTGVPDVFTPELRERFEVLDVMQALRWIHAPDEWSQLGAAQKRFRFEEALVLQLVLARRRAAHRAQGARARVRRDDGLLAAFDARLPFELTGGQREIGDLVADELGRDHPMNRLLQGEVGSGKTLVALRAMLQVVDAGGQAALLAPTEVLAQQHHRSIAGLLGDLAQGGMLGGDPDATQVVLLTGSMGKAARQEAMLRIVTGEAGIVIGTHALLEDRIEFADLGLVVVDEQHRFGVEQRAALTDKAGTPPHVLVMTATPIPRTVAMTVFGDLETSVLAELPAGRAPIQTNVVPLADQPTWLERVWQRVREEVEKGHQVYVVCPRISGDAGEEGETDQVDLDDEGREVAPKRSLAAVEEVHAELSSGPLAGLRTAVLHGRMPPDDKDRTMRAFAAGEVDVLVSTTVIEVGVDVHNATTMVLLDADRFGVSQLHQLRGRVGRGGLPGLCLLVSHAELGSPARDRLDAVAATTDGFELSRVDLEQRREGDVLGASQSGFRSGLVTLRVLRDEKTIVRAREAAEALLSEDPALAQAPALAAAVAEVERSAASAYLDKG